MAGLSPLVSWHRFNPMMVWWILRVMTNLVTDLDVGMSCAGTIGGNRLESVAKSLKDSSYLPEIPKGFP